MRARSTIRSRPDSKSSGRDAEKFRKRSGNKRIARLRHLGRRSRCPAKAAAVPNDATKHGMNGSVRKRSLQVKNQIKRRIGHLDVPGRGSRLRGPYQVRALRARWKAAEAELARPARFRDLKKAANSAGKSSGKDLGLVDWTLSKVQDLLEQTAVTSQNVEPSRPMPEIIGAIVEIVTSPTAPAFRSPVPPSTQGEPASAAPAIDSGSGDRSLITSTKLQSAITEAVKKSVPGCEAFVGVIVQRTTPKSRFDANWALRGVKFGRADRDSANEAVKAIVKRMQREFHITDD
jgi:hypothetical protein